MAPRNAEAIESAKRTVPLEGVKWKYAAQAKNEIR